jgi:hypothetical protein
MIDIIAVNSLLTDIFGLTVYIDFVPESAYKPAVSWVHISDSSVRVLDGDKTGRSNTIRVSIATDSIEDLSNYVNIGEAADNTSNADFTNIFVLNTIIASKDDTDSSYRQAFIDYQLY